MSKTTTPAMRLRFKQHKPKRSLLAWRCSRKADSAGEPWFLVFAPSAARAKQEAVDAHARVYHLVADLFKDFNRWKAVRAPEHDEYAATAQKVIISHEISEATLRVKQDS